MDLKSLFFIILYNEFIKVGRNFMNQKWKETINRLRKNQENNLHDYEYLTIQQSNRINQLEKLYKEKGVVLKGIRKNIY